MQQSQRSANAADQFTGGTFFSSITAAAALLTAVPRKIGGLPKVSRAMQLDQDTQAAHSLRFYCHKGRLGFSDGNPAGCRGAIHFTVAALPG